MEHRCSGAGGGEQDGDNVIAHAHAHVAVDAAAAATDQNCSEKGEQGGKKKGPADPKAIAPMSQQGQPVFNSSACFSGFFS